MSLLNPWVILTLLITLTGVYKYGDHNGYQRSWLEGQAEVARLNNEARIKEQSLINKVNLKAIELNKANNEAQIKITGLKSDVATGALRLSIATTSNVSTTKDSSSTSGNTSSRTELDPKTAEALITITADGDKAIRSLNQCINIYNEVREKINESK